METKGPTRKQPVILIVEDETAIADGLELNLRREGFEVLKAVDGETGTAVAIDKNPDLIILDLMLPGSLSGLDVCRNVRRSNEQVPIIILSARGDVVDKVLGLELGADDYVSKPFSVRELLARIRARLRETEGDGVQRAYQFGGIKVDFERHEVSRGEQIIEMTAKEYQLLEFLLHNRDRVLSRDEMLDQVWGRESFITTRTVDNHILHLRKKLEDDPSRPAHILSVWGEGYKFIG